MFEFFFCLVQRWFDEFHFLHVNQKTEMNPHTDAIVMIVMGILLLLIRSIVKGIACAAILYGGWMLWRERKSDESDDE